MDNTRLIRLLRSCSKTEWAALQKFVRSPYFNNRSEVVALLDVLLQSLKKEQSVPDKTQLFRKVFGSGAYDDHRVRTAMSFLYQTASQYLVVQHFLDDKVLIQKELAHIFRQRQLSERGEKALSEASNRQQMRPLRNADFFEEQYRLSLDRYRAEVDSRRTEHSDLQGLSDQLDDAFLARKLWQACFMLSHRAVHNTQFDVGLLDVVLDYLRQHPARTETPAIGLYFHCYHALTDPSEKAHFQRFRSLLHQHSALFPDDELRDIFVLALNFCSRQYNAGNTTYLPEQLQLYQEGLQRGYFLTDGSLSPYTYQNAATIGLILNELDWVERLVREYREVLKPEHREGLFHFNMARLAYRRRHLGEALALLQKAEYKDLLLSQRH